MTDEMIPTWTLGDRLRKARVSADISVDDMSAQLFRHRNTIGNWEGGNTRPPARVLAKWAEMTNVPMWWLRGEAEPESEPASKDRRTSRRATHGYQMSRPAVERHLTLAGVA